MKKPPKDGTMFIGTFEIYPIPLACMWNGASQKWSAAVPYVGPYNGLWNDWYFETEHFAEEELEYWRYIS